ncbi:hypothetical protein [Paenibacillus sp. RC67]|uniref:hypothetical protein n=1 Tax=Paenibacillus sp. RC67 TaxID=3039392 RepID=UPI0024ADF441|nr:hypothetical protein [Paenibacillus sp. RC67]
MTEKIEFKYQTGKLKDEHKSLLWDIMEIFSNEFRESGVYFTNEVTDGRPWESLIFEEKEGIWAFDAAILPEYLSPIYKDYPTEMYININENTMFVARKSVWMTEPWLGRLN